MSRWWGRGRKEDRCLPQGARGPGLWGRGRHSLPHTSKHASLSCDEPKYNTGCEGITQGGLIRGASGQGEADSRGQDPPSTRQGEGLGSSPHGTRTLRCDTCARPALPGDPQAGHESGRFTEPKDQRGQRDARRSMGEGGAWCGRRRGRRHGQRELERPARRVTRRKAQPAGLSHLPASGSDASTAALPTSSPLHPWPRPPVQHPPRPPEAAPHPWAQQTWTAGPTSV